MDNPQLNFVIISNALSLLQRLATPQINIRINKFILEIRKKYFDHSRVSPANSTQFIWVSSHVGVGGNEEADRLAKSATREIGMVDGMNVPFTDFEEKF